MPVHFVSPPKLVLKWGEEYEPRPGPQEFAIYPLTTKRKPMLDERSDDWPREFGMVPERGLPKLRRFR